MTFDLLYSSQGTHNTEHWKKQNVEAILGERKTCWASIPNEDGRSQLFDGAFDMFAGDNGVVPVTTRLRLCVVVVDKNSTSY